MGRLADYIYLGRSLWKSWTAVEMRRRRMTAPRPQVTRLWVSNPNPTLAPRLKFNNKKRE